MIPEAPATVYANSRWGIRVWRCLRLTREVRIWTIAVLLPFTLLGQTFLGTIVGTITDTSGASVPAAKVSLTDTAKNDERTTFTSTSGNYRFLNLVPGFYRMSVEKEGFSRFVRQNILVPVQGEVRSGRHA